MNIDIYNLSLAVFSTLVFASLAALKPYLVLRPSFFVGGLMVLLLSWPAVVVDDVAQAVYMRAVNYHGFSRIDELRFLIVVFPVFILAWLGLSPGLNRRARRLYQEGRELGLRGRFSRRSYAVWVVLTAGLAVYLAWFFSVRPLWETGLWAIIFEPGNYGQARQASGAELPSTGLKYVQVIMQSAVLPALFVLTWQMRLPGWKCWPKYLFLLLVLLAASLTGARSSAVIVIFAVGLAYLLLHGQRKGLAALALVVVIGVFIIAVISYHSHRGSPLHGFNSVLKGVVYSRMFSIPFTSGPMVLNYAEKQLPGGLDGANIRPWRLLTGGGHVNLSNEAYNHYFPWHTFNSGSLNTCFVFDFQAGLGLYPGWLLALAAIGLLDFLILVFSAGPPSPVRIAFQSALYVGLFALISGAFTTALLTHGLLPGLALYYLFSKLETLRFSLNSSERNITARLKEAI
jgi:hypothetical protein